ncbi:oligopeptide/dipeptide ABC transporter ATP-binding protein [Streptomyces tsukubensis]|uniref:oligopeptide/dipeptide ABC transporter ATP-binding protein n=1 Tax=Streptomyces tsukubensis TaxID=83656 RepID=UPI00344CEDA7
MSARPSDETTGDGPVPAGNSTGTSTSTTTRTGTETGARPPDAVTVEDLRVHFPLRTGVLRRVTGTARAVDGVSFTVPARSITTVVGESGSGKTTTGRALVGLSPVAGGRILIEGRPLDRLRADRSLPRVAQIVHQDPYASLNPRMTIGAMIREVVQVHRTVPRDRTADRAAELLAQVGLAPELADRYPHELSGGQRQRAAIARALAVEPRFIVCDEIVSALDVSVQGQIVNLVKDLCRDGEVSFLFISHDMSVVRHLSDRVVVMYGGRVMESGPCAEVFDTPRHPYTHSLLAAVPVPDPRAPAPGTGAAARPRAEPPDPADPPPGCRFQRACPFATEVCRTEAPPQTAVPGGTTEDTGAMEHTVACHHHDTPGVRAALGAPAARTTERTTTP